MSALENKNTLNVISTTADPGSGGFWPNVTSTADIVKMRDRLFVGGGAAFTGTFTVSQGSFLTSASAGANWAPRDSALFVGQDFGLMAVTGFASNANINTAGGQPTETIGVAGFAIGNKASRSAWGMYSDVQFEAGNYGYGIEIAVKNKEGVDRNSTPYFATTGTYGIWLPAGGDASYGGAPTNPNNTAIAIGKNASTWNKGIVFFADGITGTDGTTGTGIAMELAKGHTIRWRTPGNFSGLSVRSDISTSAADSTIVAGNTGVFFTGPNGQSFASFTWSASGANYLNIAASDAAAAPQLQALGSDADIDVRLAPKGTGRVRFGTFTSSSDVPITGSIEIRDAAGNIRKLAVIA